MQDTIKKFKFKGIGTVINAPSVLENEFTKLGFATSLDKKTKNKDTLVFVNNRDILRTKAENFGITAVTAISIDDTWSALRFRPIDRVGK